MDEKLILCYVRKPWAYFTTEELSKQWGDDWDDCPYEHNAGEPYEDNGSKIVKLAFSAELETPKDKGKYSVKEINSGTVAWLTTPSWHSGEKISISAGTPISKFIESIEKVGGEIYILKSR